MNGVDGYNYSFMYKGYIHHRYFVWSDIETNTIYFLPKMPFVEILKFDDNIKSRFSYILNNYPVYWNNYFVFQNGVKPNIVIYKHSVNYDILMDTARLIIEGIVMSINNTNYFIKNFCKES
jgi:hypothetical protein